MTDTEREEHRNLDHCLARIDENLSMIGMRLAEYQSEIEAAHDHMRQARRDMDDIDKIVMRQSIDQMMSQFTGAKRNGTGKINDLPGNSRRFGVFF